MGFGILARAVGAVLLVVGRRRCAGDSARPATDSCTNRCARRASGRNRYDAANGRAEGCACYAALHRTSAGISVPDSIPIVVSPVIGRVGNPANMHIMLVSVVPGGVVVPNRPIL